jgi:hypothetical protein
MNEQLISHQLQLHIKLLFEKFFTTVDIAHVGSSSYLPDYNDVDVLICGPLLPPHQELKLAGIDFKIVHWHTVTDYGANSTRYCGELDGIKYDLIFITNHRKFDLWVTANDICKYLYVTDKEKRKAIFKAVVFEKPLPTNGSAK